MEDVYLRSAATGKLADAGPVRLRRIPVKGDFVVSSNRRLYVVVRVIHEWDSRNEPVVVCDVAPADVALAAEMGGSGPTVAA